MRQLVGHRERPPRLAEQLRQHQPAPVMVVAAHRVGQHFGGHDAHLDAVPVGQPGSRRRGEALRLGVQLGGQRLAGLVQIGEEVALALDIVAHPVRWRQRQTGVALLGPRGLTEFGEAPAVGVRPVKPHDRVGDARRCLGHLRHLVARHRQVAKQRIGEHLGEIARVGRLLVGREAADIDVVRLGQAQQHLGRDRALIALQIVQIAWADAEILRHAGLGEALVTAQPPQPRPQKQLAFERLRHALSIVTNPHVRQGRPVTT